MITEEQIKHEAHVLVEKIQETDVYMAYAAAREEIEKYPLLYEEVNDYRKKNFELQNSVDEEHLLEALEDFRKQYEDFRANPLVDRFLSAELAFCRMMQDIILTITDEIDFEI